MRKLLIVLIIIGIVFVSLAPFTFLGPLQKFLPQIFPNNSGQQETINPTPAANIKRSFDETLSSTFVTPIDPAVVELKDSILKDKPVSTPNWVALRDWVGTNIKYKDDKEVHGEDDYWQFPSETITMKTGDCEDFSVLLCSLLRADGWKSNDVHVMLGISGNRFHAWVRVNWENLQYNIEPQGTGFAIVMGETLTLSGYTAKYYFNDAQSGTL